jgi:hypothetical protein
LVFLLAAFASPASAAQYFQSPSGKKRQYSAKQATSKKVPFLKRSFAVKQYPGRYNTPKKNTSPFRRGTRGSWSGSGHR